MVEASYYYMRQNIPAGIDFSEVPEMKSILLYFVNMGVFYGKCGFDGDSKRSFEIRFN